MITIFNRARLTSTFSLERQTQIRAKLEAAGIEYHVSALGGATQGAETGTFGLNRNAMYEYVFYVKRGDLELANYSLGESIN